MQFSFSITGIGFLAVGLVNFLAAYRIYGLYKKTNKESEELSFFSAAFLSHAIFEIFLTTVLFFFLENDLIASLAYNLGSVFLYLSFAMFLIGCTISLLPRIRWVLLLLVMIPGLLTVILGLATGVEFVAWPGAVVSFKFHMPAKFLVPFLSSIFRIFSVIILFFLALKAQSKEGRTRAVVTMVGMILAGISGPAHTYIMSFPGSIIIDIGWLIGTLTALGGITYRRQLITKESIFS